MNTPPKFLAALAACIFGLNAVGCTLFETRVPEEPTGQPGTWLQPDTPERVAENVKASIREMNVQNYQRSLSAEFRFEPAARASAREPLLWTTWGRTEEHTYFSRLQAAAERFSGHQLQFLEENRTVISESRFELSATYLLTVLHVRETDNIPTEVQGRLVWEITQHEDGLWAITRWSDQDSGTQPSWSDLKAAFVK